VTVIKNGLVNRPSAVKNGLDNQVVSGCDKMDSPICNMGK